MASSAKTKRPGTWRWALGIAMTFLLLAALPPPHLNKTWQVAVDNYENIRLGYELEQQANEWEMRANHWQLPASKCAGEP